MTIKLLQITTMILVVSSLFSCKTDNELGQEIVTLNVSLGGEEYDEQEVVFAGKSTANNSRSTDKSSLLSAPAVQIQEIPLDDGFYISAEVTSKPAVYRPSGRKSSSGGKRAALVVSPIQRTISFRLAAYNSGGNFVQAKVYSIAANGTVTPADGVAMQLPNGQYTFIAYSYNTNTAPTENLTGTTASNFTIANAPVANGFMVFNSGLITVSSQATVNLNVILRHLTSPMQVLIDASATNGYLITNVGATTLGTTRGTATVNLSTGAVTNFAGTTTTQTISYPSTTAADEWVSNIAYFSNNTTAGTLSIASLTVGPLNRTTPINFNNINILPGVAYTVRLRLNPADGFETIAGQEAAFIGGRYWMRRNLGVATTVNPDVPNATASIGFRDHIGSYFQWGRITARGNGNSTANQTGAHWATREESLTAWNTGTETAPVKNATNDPCPSGWRVPTRNEWNLLLANTTQNESDNVGSNWTAGPTNYATAKVFRSLRDRNVILTFPSGGAYTPTAGANNTTVGALQSRGNAGAYWTSQSIAPETAALNAARLVTNQTSATMGQGNNNKNFAINVRCIRDVQ
ncbi:FISUMP domain-containing protein [Sphingobacterium deserti]|uniref:Fibrobacter succinogenes major paralogous domain-containing protein n=1 Tax=Sphingobacterium deserti TaxID=1229276 RepID=A0A0B8T476_9SPHI|nr:FISUMP domain-containing protein [Sphingobacterium deserti]KGE14193.1 hypothetical protein DI53_2023 [Sphingobacterium deserti]